MDQGLIKEIRAMYNSGDCKRALDLAEELLKKYPDNPEARYYRAAMHGDYSYSAELSSDQKAQHRQVANQGIKDLALDPNLSSWPEDFQFKVQNEYFWFFEMPLEQYHLGLKRLAAGSNGHYSACVGASMLALSKVKSRDFHAAEKWAEISLEHFRKFEEISPNWYNINYFSAQALACLGLYDEAIDSFNDMFRKQKSNVNGAELEEFLKVIEMIKNSRA